MRNFVPASLVLLLPALAGCSRPPAPAAPASQTAGGMIVRLTTDPAPPHTGDDTLILTLTDAATGAPVGDANVTASADALGPRLSGTINSGRAQGNGVYQVPVRLAVSSRYMVQVQIQRTGRPPVAVSFPIEAAQ